MPASVLSDSNKNSVNVICVAFSFSSLFLRFIIVCYSYEKYLTCFSLQYSVLIYLIHFIIKNEMSQKNDAFSETEGNQRKKKILFEDSLSLTYESSLHLKVRLIAPSLDYPSRTDSGRFYLDPIKDEGVIVFYDTITCPCSTSRFSLIIRKLLTFASRNDHKRSSTWETWVCKWETIRKNMREFPVHVCVHVCMSALGWSRNRERKIDRLFIRVCVCVDLHAWIYTCSYPSLCTCPEGRGAKHRRETDASAMKSKAERKLAVEIE